MSLALRVVRFLTLAATHLLVASAALRLASHATPANEILFGSELGLPCALLVGGILYTIVFGSNINRDPDRHVSALFAAFVFWYASAEPVELRVSPPIMLRSSPHCGPFVSQNQVSICM